MVFWGDLRVGLEEIMAQLPALLENHREYQAPEEVQEGYGKLR